MKILFIISILFFLCCNKKSINIPVEIKEDNSKEIDNNVKSKNIWEALKDSNIDYVRTYIDKGFDINAKKGEKMLTPLMIVSKYGDVNIVELLLANKVEIDIKDNLGNTALMIASYYGHLEIVKLLLENDVDVNIKNDKKVSVLLKGINSGSVEIVKLLIESGAKIDERDVLGNTVLMEASRYGYIEIVELLLEKGVDINEKNGKGISASEYANNNNYYKISELLRATEVINSGKFSRKFSEIKYLSFDGLKNAVVSGDLSKLETGLLDNFELAVLDKYELKMLKNMIYAKYGYKFDSKAMEKYFSKFDWYNPEVDDVLDLLTDNEKEIIRKIDVFEKGYNNKSILTERDVIGYWHLSLICGISSLERYVLFSDHTFVFMESDLNSHYRIDRLSGYWELKDNKLNITLNNRNINREGKIVADVSRAEWTFYRINGEFVEEEIDPPVEMILPLSDIYDDGMSSNNSFTIFFGIENYYLRYKNPKNSRDSFDAKK